MANDGPDTVACTSDFAVTIGLLKEGLHMYRTKAIDMSPMR